MCQNLSIIIATPPLSDQPQPDIPFTQTLRVLSLSMLGECYGSECIQKCWIIFFPSPPPFIGGVGGLSKMFH